MVKDLVDFTGFYVTFADKWYARSAGRKLTSGGELFDMSAVPFAEKLVPPGSESAAAKAARQKRQAVLTELNPGVLKAAPEVEPEGTKAPRKKKAWASAN